ncbi:MULTISPECIES: hypothetical protein [unclassified Pseudomonas]|uniref:hypothetical protein n=1 Tax=unclassified Pseudomonas TaxID=196821 RepID=UPI0030DC6EBA
MDRTDIARDAPTAPTALLVAERAPAVAAPPLLEAACLHLLNSHAEAKEVERDFFFLNTPQLESDSVETIVKNGDITQISRA